MPASDISQPLQERIVKAIENKTALNIQGGGTKSFYGRKVSAELLETKEHQGIISYEPTELVITARAGTKLGDIVNTLAEHNQMLAFEPPAFGQDATIGGTIACNLSGPRRAYSGAARDFVLGTRIINGKGEILSFGGEVMKNVAGYDVSRLMTGAMGTLGVILDVSLKVIPRPESELTLAQQGSVKDALKRLSHWAQSPLPVSASCFTDDGMYIRLSGTAGAIKAAKQIIGGEELTNSDMFWQSIKEQQHAFFNKNKNLWRISIAANTDPLKIEGDTLYEWGGALRWIASNEETKTIQSIAARYNGHACLFRNHDNQDCVFQPLARPLMKIHEKVKQAFDPDGIFNPGRMYSNF